jgi:uncharacterized protein (TIGR02231 family)
MMSLSLPAMNEVCHQSNNKKKKASNTEKMQQQYEQQLKERKEQQEFDREQKEQHEFDILKAPLLSVTIYQTNAAMLTRQQRITIKDKSKEQVVVFTNLNHGINSSSIRVAGTGDCTIADISFIRRKEVVQHDQTNRNQLELKLNTLQEECDKLIKEKQCIQKQVQFLNNYKSAVVQVSHKDANIEQLMNVNSLDRMTQFMMFVSEQNTNLSCQLLKLESEIDQLELQVRKINSEIVKEKPQYTLEEKMYCNVTLLSNECGQVELTISYIVSNASWKPTYDIRVNSNEKKLEICYYGIITQNTKEDWTNTSIRLSTADPSNSASPPPLDRMVLRVVHPFQHSPQKNRRSSVESGAKDEMKKMVSSSPSASRSSQLKKKKSKKVKVAETIAEQSAISTTFHIPVTSSIPSDNSPHKVTITNLSLDAKLSYVSVPKLDTNAYLKAELVNTSVYPLLNGAMNVFVDNSLVSTGMMIPCNPNEEFSNFLGPDPSIKIQYNSPKRFRESVGMLKNSNKVTVEKKIIIKNTKNQHVQLMISDVVPKSSDEKITVKVKTPENVTDVSNSVSQPPTIVKLKGGADATVLLNEQNSKHTMEWTLSVAPAREIEIDLVYCVTWPSSALYIDMDSL